MARKVVQLSECYNSLFALCDDGSIHQYTIKGDEHIWITVKLPTRCVVREVSQPFQNYIGTGPAFAPDGSWSPGVDASSGVAPRSYMGPTGSAVPVSAKPPPSVSNKSEPEPDNDEPFAEWIR